jgi:hypothetical protein
MTRTQARQVFRDLYITGEIYRGFTLISLDPNEWRITQRPYKCFDSRQDARDWINEHIREQNSEMLMDKRHELCWDER